MTIGMSTEHADLSDIWARNLLVEFSWPFCFLVLAKRHLFDPKLHKK